MVRWVRMRGVLNNIVEKITGLNPRAILCVGQGFVREEWKALCFKRRKTLSQKAILSSKQIAQLLVPQSDKRILENTARLELLRQAVKNSQIKEALPVLCQRQFRPRFFEGLDRALQQGRMFFAHADEAQVFEERLKEKTGVDLKREEFFLLNRYWESLLRARELWDEARLYADASEALAQTSSLDILPAEIFKLEHFDDTPRVAHFWNELSRSVQVTRISSASLAPSLSECIQLNRKEAHSLEDAVLFLFDHFQDHCTDAASLNRQAIVIPDQPALRRTIKRIANARGLPLQDARDPTQVLQSEEMKLATLELELVAKNFTAESVMTWLSLQPALAPFYGVLRKQIIERGIVSGIDAYSFFPEAHAPLKEIQKRYSSRCTLAGLRQSIQESVRALALPGWVNQVLDRIFTQWQESFEQIELTEHKRPARYWLEQLRDKIKKATPVVAPVKHEFGIQLFRVDQAISLNLIENNDSDLAIHFVGVDASFFEPREQGNEWFSIRDREILAKEFGLVSTEELQKKNLDSFCTWASLSTGKYRHQAFLWDYVYNESGGEREPADLNLIETSRFQLSEKIELGLHPSLHASVFAKLKTPPVDVQIDVSQTEWPVSFLNAYGNCAFAAYAGHLLKIYDERETDFELKGDVYGNLVHTALEEVLKFNKTSEEAFDHAWKKNKAIALLKSDRLYRSIRYKTIRMIDEFKQSEAEYYERSGAKPTHFELPVEFKKNGLVFKGRIDRVDQHADGLVLVDYKTSASQSPGKQMLEKGLDLQLPLYALAIQEQLSQPVITAQYLQLSPAKINRNVGMLFTKWNVAKKADAAVVLQPITKASSRSQSLFSETPEEIWTKVDEKLTLLVEAVKAGQFSAKPADIKVCTRCRYTLVCGKPRMAAEEEVQEGESE